MIKLIVYGLRAGPRPDDLQLDFDVRWSKNPHHNKRLRQLTGLHPAVIDEVRGAPDYWRHIIAMAERICARGAARVGIHCLGGRHRSPVVAGDVAQQLRAAGLYVEVEYRTAAVREYAALLKQHGRVGAERRWSGQ